MSEILLNDVSEFKEVLKTLIDNSTKNELNNYEIDVQFSSILDHITEEFTNSLVTGNYSTLFDYITESIKLEKDLRAKFEFEKQRKFTSTNLYVLGLLIVKVNLIHTKIISLVVDEILLIYSDILEIKERDFDVAYELKVTAVKLANFFILYLTDNRSVDDKYYDKYINLISQSLKIFR